MSAQPKKDVWVKVRDHAGNEFICPLDVLKNPETATEEELERCVDDAVTGRYAGNLDIEE